MNGFDPEILLFDNLGESPDFKKIKHMLIGIFKNQGEDNLYELLRNARFEVLQEKKFLNSGIKLKIHVTPIIFTNVFSSIEPYKSIIRDYIMRISKYKNIEIEIFPDYNKLQMIHYEIISVQTEWEEINECQNRLIRGFESSSIPIDFQNIGNISRTIMQLLANKVFNHAVHVNKEINMDLSDGKFKNQLHAYIDYELAGKNNYPFKQLAKSGIEFVENAIDLMNKTTHKLNASVCLAETCVVSTFTAVSLIKMINDMKKI